MYVCRFRHILLPFACGFSAAMLSCIERYCYCYMFRNYTFYSSKGKTDAIHSFKSFDFVFIMHVMKELMCITDLLCKNLQQQSQDIMNAMDDVATTKKLNQNLGVHGWGSLISDVTSFCSKHNIVVSDMNEFYADFIRSHAKERLTVEHHYRYDIFNVAVDKQLHALNYRFIQQATKLLILCNSQDPKDSFKSLKIDDVCLLASKFYFSDFSEQEMNILKRRLQYYALNVPTNPNIKDLSTVEELCRHLVETGKIRGVLFNRQVVQHFYFSL